MGQRFDIPPLSQINSQIEQIRRNIEESRNLRITSRKYLKNYLNQINQIQRPQDNLGAPRNDNPSSLEVYKWFVTKEKAIYSSINFMRQGNATYIGYFWSPSEREDEVRVKLRTYPTTSIERFENHSIKPPTFIKSNDFTFVFQEIVNTYGVPMHKEINPAVFAIVTFPFLFGVMFGDVGHGFLVFLMGLIFIMINRKYKNDPDMEGYLSMRYILLMMGFFAMFSGLIYNEFFAIPMTIFGPSLYKLEV
jgi:V-type H+-transporting ATPase subunit a